MPADGAHPIIAEQGILHVPGNYQPIHLEDTAGAIFPGILAMILLVGCVLKRAIANYETAGDDAWKMFVSLSKAPGYSF